MAPAVVCSPASGETAKKGKRMRKKKDRCGFADDAPRRMRGRAVQRKRSAGKLRAFACEPAQTPDASAPSESEAQSGGTLIGNWETTD